MSSLNELPGVNGDARPAAGGPRDWAAYYLSLGWAPIPLPPRSKAPLLDGWAALRPAAGDLDGLFPAGTDLNVGVLLGEASGGLVDVDLDAPEAVAAAPFLLPPTGRVSGRGGKPKSHFWYLVKDPPRRAAEKFRDVDRKVLVELRSTGAQTVLPPSTHADTGERVVWHAAGDPVRVELATLRAAVRAVAAAATLARHWPAVGARHDARLALAGGLLRGGMAESAAAAVVSAVCEAAGNDGRDDCAAVVRDTAARMAAGDLVVGWPTLAKLLTGGSGAVVVLAREWLGVKHGDDAALGLATTGLDSVTPEPVTWLVPGYLPLGKLTLIAGDGGHGKSTLTLDLAARLTTGTPALGLAYDAPPPAEVLLVGCEDDTADTVLPRLLSAGADLSRVRKVDGIRASNGKTLPFTLAGVGALDAELAARPDVRLVVVDPIAAYVAGADDHKDADIRQLLGPLAELAARRRVAVVAVRHLNKGMGRAVHRVTGSVAYTNAVRAAFLVCPAKDDPARKLLLVLKFNLGPPPSGLAYRLTPLTTAEQAGVLTPFSAMPDADKARLGAQLFRVLFEGVVGVSADEALAESDRRERRPTAADEAAAWLTAFLADGEAKPAAEVLAAAMAAGFSKPTLQRAKDAMGVLVRKTGGRGAGWTWRLPDAAAKNPALDAASTPLVGLTPLNPLADPRTAKEIKEAKLTIYSGGEGDEFFAPDSANDSPPAPAPGEGEL